MYCEKDVTQTCEKTTKIPTETTISFNYVYDKLYFKVFKINVLPELEYNLIAGSDIHRLTITGPEFIAIFS